MSAPTSPAAAPPDDFDVPSRPRTLAELPFFTSGRFPRPNLIGQCRDGAVTYTSGRDLVPKVRDLGLGLASLGLTAGDRVAVLSESRPEWLIADFAVLAQGAVTTPIYPTLSADQIAYILRDCGAKIAIVSTPVQLEKLLTVAHLAPGLETVVTIDPPAVHSQAGHLRILSFDQVSALGHDRLRAGWGVARAFHDAARRVRPDDLATIIYTSGTTGDPKGVMLTHHNIIANMEGTLAMLDLGEDDFALSFLPLCHGFERMVAYIYMTVGVSVTFAESFDTIPRDLLLVRPTVMSGVPRVFEKLRARVFEKAAAAPAPRRAIFRWAVSVAMRRGRLLADGRPVPATLRASAAVADGLVFSKVRAGIGGRLRYAVSGSAPLDPELGRFFYGMGLPILEGYGLTETSPVLSVMPIGNIRFGTVGPPLPNIEVKIAEDGEILVRGPNVMRGYHGLPEDTAAVVVDGWFHTGDIGTLDEAGFLCITDRKKEVIVTSGGKKIAPQPIEQKLRAHDLIADAVLVGDRRHFAAAMIRPDFVALAAQLGTTADAVRAQLSSPGVQSRIQAVVDGVNAGLAQFERVKKFVLFTEELTMANGMLTPTLKVKRRVFAERYRDDIDAIYR